MCRANMNELKMAELKLKTEYGSGDVNRNADIGGGCLFGIAWILVLLLVLLNIMFGGN